MSQGEDQALEPAATNTRASGDVPRCEVCDRASCPTLRPIPACTDDRKGECPGCAPREDCERHAVDWRERALASESRSERMAGLLKVTTAALVHLDVHHSDRAIVEAALAALECDETACRSALAQWWECRAELAADKRAEFHALARECGPLPTGILATEGEPEEGPLDCDHPDATGDGK